MRGRSTIGDSMLDLQNIVDKPMITALHPCATDKGERLALEANVMLRKARFPVYPSVRRAASAIDKSIRYQEWSGGGQGNDV